MSNQAAHCPVCGTTYLIKDGCLRCNPLPPARGQKSNIKGIESPEAHEESQELKTGAAGRESAVPHQLTLL